MLRSVDLYYHFRTRSVKINNKITQRFLTIKLDTQQLFSAQMQPEYSLGIRHVSTQLAGTGLKRGVVRLHKSPSILLEIPLNPPLPKGEVFLPPRPPLKSP